MNTNTALLERRALPEIDPADLMRDDVLDYAHTQLGYHHPKKEHLCKEGSLAKALRVAGIVPFTQDSVTAYKKAQVAKYDRLKRFVAPLIKFALISLALAIGSVLVHLGVDLAMVKAITGISATVTSLVFVGCIIPFFVLAITDKRAVWRKLPLNEYQSPVPGFALATAKEIHLRVPQATFFIDELRLETRERDPFLIVTGDGEEYYVEVWDEPKYEQKRMA